VNGAPTIATTSPLPAGLVGSPYLQTLSVTGTAPITWSIANGALPAGMQMNASVGVIGGTPTAAGVSTITLTATNSYGSSSAVLSLTVNAAPSILTTLLPAAVAGTAYSQTLSASGSNPITWSVTGEPLPNGLTLNASSGVISGTPASAGTASFTLTATNAYGNSSQLLTLTVNAAIGVSLAPGTATLTISQSQQLTATVTGSSNAAVTWSLAPAVGTITSGGLYTAPASIAAAQTVVVTATSVADSTKSATTMITLKPAAVSLTPATVSLQPSQNQTFTASVSGTANTTVTWSLSQTLGSYASTATSLTYIAPSTAATAQTVTITATSSADPTKTATAVITLPQTTIVSVSPTTVSLSTSGTQQFTATVVGNNNTSVTWSINPSVGAISSSGLYTAPSSVATSETVTVTAVSPASPVASASATVTLTPSTYTYYVDSVNGSDSNPGTITAPWKTIAKVNSTTLLPGQAVAFKAAGLWREQLTASNGGTAGNPITFTAYGAGVAPIISGANLFTSWTTAFPYYATFVTVPTQVFRNGVRLTQASAQAGLATGTWWLDSANGRIYVYDNPAGNIIEASQRTYAVTSPCSYRSYVTFLNLQVQMAQDDGLYVCSGTVGSNFVVSGVTSLNNYYEGIRFDGAVNSTISYCTAAYNGADGIDFYNSPNLLIDHAITHDNVQVSGNLYMAGIKGNDSGRLSTNIVIQNSIAYSNGLGQSNSTGSGIWIDTIGTNAIIRDNTVYDNNIIGINIDADNYASLYYNVSYNNGATGIQVYADGQTSMTGNLVYHNTVWGNNSAGIMLLGPSAGSTPGGCVANQVINNIATNTIGGSNFIAFLGCENPGTNGTGNIYTHNAFGLATTDFIRWSGTFGSPIFYSTYATWEMASGACGSAGCSDSLQQNPLLNNPTGGDFTLQSSSPAIGTGMYIPGISTANSPNIGAK